MSITGDLLSNASCTITYAIRRLRAQKLKRTDGQRLVIAMQRLQLLVNPELISQAAWLSFAAITPARVAVSAKALASPILTLKLWGIKDLTLLISQANGIATSSEEANRASLTVADAVNQEAIPSLLLGDYAHEEVLSLSLIHI